MTPFRQLIRQGESGRDVTAVKLAMVSMHVPNSGALVIHGAQRDYAGHSFAGCIRSLQKNHSLHQDGVYGRTTHEIVAPHFTPYDRWLYRTARIRKPVPPPVPATAQAAAKELLALHAEGKYRDDRGTELPQIEATASGHAVWSPLGYYVHLDERILQALCWLIRDQAFKIGTFAMCSDHGADSPMGHAGGHAVDISSIDGYSVASSSAATKGKVVSVLKALHAAPPHLRAWQLISGGYGNHLDSTCEGYTIPGAAFYGPQTMFEHCNHIHLGYE